MPKLYCAHQGAHDDGTLWCSVYRAWGGWAADHQLTSIGVTDSPALAQYNDRLYCVHQSPHDGGYLFANSFDGMNWSGDSQIGDVRLSNSPSCAIYDHALLCAYQGPSNNGELHWVTLRGTAWSSDQQAKPSGGRIELSGTPSLAEFRGQLFCAHQGADDNGELWYTTWDGETWRNDEQIGPHGDVTISDSPALIALQDKLYCFHQGGRENGQLWYTVFNGEVWSPDTPVSPSDGSEVVVPSSPTAAELDPSHLLILHQGQQPNSLWYTSFDLTNDSWQRDTLVPGVGISGCPAAAWF
jgi:hypothetical protein